jgi:tRNA nucleotidyltransferase/poly(A) polymerase
MPRDHLHPEDLAEPAEKVARERLEAEMKRALWAQQASRSWAALTAAKASQPNL